MNKKLTLNLSLTTLITVLVAFGLGLGLGLWSPWADDGTTRTVSLEGSSTVEVEPDEFVFNPSIEVTETSEASAKQQAEANGSELAESMKELGVEENQLESNLNTRQAFNEEDEWRSTYRLTITVSDEELSQEIYSALLDNDTVGGSIDPVAQLSDEQRKEIEQSARTEAIADAREQAERSAEELGKNLGEVVSVEDVQGFDGVRPYMDIALESQTDPSRSSQFYGGTEDVTFTVKATFELN